MSTKFRDRAPRMLFVGDDWYGSNATSLRDGFIEAGVEVRTVDSYGLGAPRARTHRRIINKLAPAVNHKLAVSRISEAVRRALKEGPEFDLMVVFKGVHVAPELIENFKGTTVHYHPDDSSNPENRSATYDAAEGIYDHHITTKLHNVDELRLRTKSAVHFVRCAYDPRWHKVVSYASSSRLGLIGTKRPDRIEFVLDCANLRDMGEKMLIAGTGWGRDLRVVRSAEVHPPKYGLEFSKFVSLAPIQLGVLNSANRDTHTCRTYEIPAAGGLFLGEWTEEHADIFSKSGTAMLYRSDEEALDMIRWIQHKPDYAIEMRQKGQKWICEGKNSYADRAHEILSLISSDNAS